MGIGTCPVSEAIGDADGIAEIKIEHGQVDLYTETCAKVVKMKLGFFRFKFNFFVLIINPPAQSETVGKPTIEEDTEYRCF